MSSETTNNQVQVNQTQAPANKNRQGGRRFKDGEKKDLTPEQIARKNINKTFDRQVNTKFCKFTPLRKFQNAAKAEGITVVVNKGENKAKISAVIVLTDLAKNKTTIRKESSVVEEIHNLPPYVKNQNLFEQITAKFYKGQGVIVCLPIRPERRNKQDRKNRTENNQNDEVVKENNTQENENNNSQSESKFVDVDISHITEAAVDIAVKFE